MKIVLFGATGDVGSNTLQEAVKRGHTITAIARNIDKLADVPSEVALESLDVLANPERVTELMARHDVAISALRPINGSEGLLVDMSKVLLDAARQTKAPIYLTGGAATLKLADDSGHTVLSAPDFLPDAVRPIAEACADQDALFDQYEDVQWTCLRPPAMLIDGPLTGQYVRGTDTLVPDHDGMARISYADFGYAMVDLIEGSNGGQQRLTVGYQNKTAA